MDYLELVDWTGRAIPCETRLAANGFASRW
jgi:hypothetical protein